MFTNYANLQILIGPRNDGEFPLSVRSAEYGQASGTLRLPTHDATYQQVLQRLEVFKTSEEDLQYLGQCLFDALLQGPAKTVYDTTISAVEGKRNYGLRITLSISASEGEAGALPWEFLYDPSRGHLSLLNAPMLRYLDLPISTTSLATALPLKVLLTGAQAGGEPLQVERELNEVREALKTLSDNIAFEVEPHLTINKFQQLLRKGFHVWHFVGHGGVNAQGNGIVLFENDQGDAHRLSANQLSTALFGSDIQLILLNACNSAHLDTDPFRSLAPALIKARVPAVVAMQFAIPDSTARVFAGEFYRALSEGFPIDACVTEGRRAVSFAIDAGRPDWGIPVVYSRAESGKLFDLPSVPSASSEPTPTSTNQSGNANVNLSGNTITSSTVNINTGTQNVTNSSPATTNIDSTTTLDDHAEQKVEALQSEITQRQRQLQYLRLQDARGAGTAATALAMQDLDTQILDAHRQIIALRTEQLARLTRNKQPDAATVQRINDVHAELLDEQLTTAKTELKALNDRLRIQTSAAGRERIGAQVNAKNSEIATLQQQRDALKGKR